jgi:hypothetical protein
MVELSWRYPVVVQVVTKDGRDYFFGYSPDFGFQLYEPVEPGNSSQEIIFHLRVRRAVSESLTVLQMEKHEAPPIRAGKLTHYYDDETGAGESKDSLVSSTAAAKLLNVHPETIRRLFDSGVLVGSLSHGRQRLVSLNSLQNEKLRMTGRADLRRLEQRSKRKNVKRRQKRVQKSREDRVLRVQESIDHQSVLHSSKANSNLPEQPSIKSLD